MIVIFLSSPLIIEHQVPILQTTVNNNVEVSKIDQCAIFSCLFYFLAILLYRDEMEISSKTCYVKFKDKASCDVSQHLTNTVFIDRPLVVVPLTEGKIHVVIKFDNTSSV